MYCLGLADCSVYADEEGEGLFSCVVETRTDGFADMQLQSWPDPDGFISKLTASEQAKLVVNPNPYVFDHDRTAIDPRDFATRFTAGTWIKALCTLKLYVFSSLQQACVRSDVPAFLAPRSLDSSRHGFLSQPVHHPVDLVRHTRYSSLSPYSPPPPYAHTH